ncbi:hypothetical protein [Bifidobacterium platyrrhinorum]|uniref:hypothetical protein n=1 Tax=Bifidobacterium platyrrhinorum TaxID=2661628 RepID=UPI0013D41559|nr:hypothetical protein [Bifidobacterium platyrrhinorum]
MKRKTQGIGGIAFAIIAAACAVGGAQPWITALFAVAAGLDCLHLGFFGGRDDD